MIKQNKIKKAVICIMIICIVLPLCLSGCSRSEKELVSLGDYGISANLYQLMLTQQKGNMAYAIHSEYGSYNSEKFWGMTIDKATQKTNEQYYNELVLERAKNYLCAMALFDELEATKPDFEFPAAYEKNIDAAIKNMIEVDAGGSKNKLNSILSEYGINVRMLKDFLIMDAKAIYVVDYLYGTDGSKIGDVVKEEYYEENYVSCKQILIQKFYYIYETDDDGNVIYYSPENGHPIYDTSKTPGFNADGTSIVDEHGTRVYYNEDGSVAYDTAKGEKQIKIDEVTGQEIYKTYSDDAIAELREKALKLAAEAEGKGINIFESMRIEHSADYDSKDSTGGMMYYDSNVNYSSFTSSFIDDIVESLSEMKVGDVKLMESDLSINIFIKTELEDKAWENEKYEGYFKDEAYGVFDFVNNLKTELYSARLLQYADKISVNDQMIEKLDFSISNVSPNYYYPDPAVAYYLYKEE